MVYLTQIIFLKTKIYKNLTQMVVASDNGSDEKICVRFMKIYGQSTKFL